MISKSASSTSALVVLLLLLGTARLFLGAPEVAVDDADQGPDWIAYDAETLESASGGLLPDVELRRFWSGFALRPADDRTTPLHFEVLADGRLGWGPMWLSQKRSETHPELVVVRLENESGRASVLELRRTLASAGMMAADAPLEPEKER